MRENINVTEEITEETTATEEANVTEDATMTEETEARETEETNELRYSFLWKLITWTETYSDWCLSLNSTATSLMLKFWGEAETVPSGSNITELSTRTALLLLLLDHRNRGIFQKLTLMLALIRERTFRSSVSAFKVKLETATAKVGAKVKSVRTAMTLPMKPLKLPPVPPKYWPCPCWSKQIWDNYILPGSPIPMPRPSTPSWVISISLPRQCKPATKYSACYRHLTTVKPNIFSPYWQQFRR